MILYMLPFAAAMVLLAAKIWQAATLPASQPHGTGQRPPAAVNKGIPAETPAGLLAWQSSPDPLLSNTEAFGAGVFSSLIVAKWIGGRYFAPGLLRERETPYTLTSPRPARTAATVAASWTIGAEHGGCAQQLGQHDRVSHFDLRAFRGCGPACAGRASQG